MIAVAMGVPNPPIMGAPKRTGGNVLLFADIAEEACTDPAWDRGP